MSQEYMSYDRYFSVNMPQQRQSPAVQSWSQCSPESAIEAYQPSALWTQNPYPQSASTLSSPPNASAHQLNTYEDDHVRSLSRSPEYQGKQWTSANDVIYGSSLAAAVPAPASSPPRQSLSSRPTSAAPSSRPSAAQSRASSVRPSPERQKPKVESTDVQIGFVMEPMGACGTSSFPAATPLPMEVPLRATQASRDMRKMMNVFRLNPFAVQNGEAKRSGSVCSTDSGSTIDSLESSPMPYEAKPLEEEPLLFEFQVQLNDPDNLVPESDRLQEAQIVEKAPPLVSSPLSTSPLPLFESSEEPLHAFPPDFELHREGFEFQSQDRSRSWESTDYAGPSTTWDREVDAQRDYDSSLMLQSARSVPSQSYVRQSARNNYQYSYDQQLGMTSISEPYSSLRYAQGHPTPPRSRTESPFAEDIPSFSAPPVPARHLTIDNSELYSQDQSGGFYANVGPATASATEDPSSTTNTTTSPSHRRWSFPAEAPGAMSIMMTSHPQTMSHVNHTARMVMTSHQTHTDEPFFVSQMH